MPALYRCTKSNKALRIVESKVYREWNHHPDPFNAAVENDNGKIVFVERSKHFRKVSEVK